MANQQSKNIQYSGLTTLPDDYQSVDGSLAFATNAVYEDNAVKIIPPALAKNLIVQKGDKVYVHSMATYTHYIVAHQTLAERDEEGNIVSGADEVTLYWVDEKSCEEGKVYCVTDAQVDNGVEKEGDEETGPVFTIGTYAGTFVDLAFVGNTMILSTSESLQYILWKAEDNNYLYLGDKIPTVNMQWGLNLTLGRNVFLNTGITTEKKKGLSAGEGYRIVGMCEYNHPDIMSDDYDFTPLVEDYKNDGTYGREGTMKLNKGTRYRTYQYVTSSHSASPNIHGTRLTSGKNDNLCDIPQKSRDYKYFTANHDYRATWLRVQQRESSGIVYIEESLSDTTVESTQIKDDNDDGMNNFTAVMGYMNKFVNEQGRKADRFVYPFMLRYAVKLYDGTWCNLSTPILLYPNTGYAPFMKIIQQSGYANLEAYAFTAGLHYELHNFIDENWKDLIQGVGVFVSQQIYPYDQGATWEAGVSSYEYLYSRNAEEYLDEDKTKKNPSYVNNVKGTSYGIGSYDGGTTDGTLVATSESGEDEGNTTVTVKKDEIYSHFGTIVVEETGGIEPTSVQTLAEEDDPTAQDNPENLVNNDQIIAYISAKDAEGEDIALTTSQIKVNTNDLGVTYNLANEVSEGVATGVVRLIITRENSEENVSGYIYITTTIEGVEYQNALWISTESDDEPIVSDYETGDYGVIDINGPLSSYGYHIKGDNDGDAVATVQIAKKKQGEIQDDILNTCNFYKIGEIDFDDLLGSTYDGILPSTDFEIEEGTLNSLEARETLKEEEISVNGFQGVNLFVYNNRLHVTGGTRSLASVTASMRQNGRVDLPNGEMETDGNGDVSQAVESCLIPRKDGEEYYKSAVMVRTDEGTRMVMCKDADGNDGKTAYLAPWFFYPDTRAYQYIEFLPEAFWKTDSEGNILDCIVYELKAHDFLNGVYLLRDVGRYCRAVESLAEHTTDEYLERNNKKWETAWGEKDTDVDLGSDTEGEVLNEAKANDKIGNLNKIYVSEASNPFVFKNSMVCTAGSGQVLALSSAAKALSQGQFGQFPLYAFTDEGIWAMSVGTTGAYETVQPIARDVVTNVAAITQLDSAVVMVTARGVMLVEGSNVVCMSDAIDGDFGQFDPRELPDFKVAMGKWLGFSGSDTDKTVGKWASQAFFDFIKTCQMRYDYIHQRITMYSDACDIAYVYSLKSKQWLMQLTALQDNVNSYPDAYALRNTEGITYEGENGEEVTVDCTELVNLSEYDLEAARLPMVFVTRPFKLDAPDTFKTVNDIMQRGYFRQDEKEKHVLEVVLYGSPDLFNWFKVKGNEGHKIQNVQGSPYKYFRVMVVSQLDAKEGISGCSVWFTPKDTQRMR